MVDEPSPPITTDPTSPGPAKEVDEKYVWLRWAIRITGIALMLGGTIYLGVMTAKLLTDTKSGDAMYVVASLIALGLGIFMLRIGFNMLRSINARTIASFSFVFALIYTFILIQILPSSGMLNDHPLLSYLLIFLHFGLSYWIVKSILFHLLLPRNER